MRREAILDRVRSHGRLVLFEHAGHMNFPETYPDLYQRSVLGFLRDIKKGDEMSDQAVRHRRTRVIDPVLALSAKDEIDSRRSTS